MSEICFLDIPFYVQSDFLNNHILIRHLRHKVDQLDKKRVEKPIF